MDEVLTWEEIERRFDGEWIAIANPEVTDDLEILRGRVVYHGDSYEEAYASLRQIGARSTAVEFIGEPIDDGIPLIL